MTEREVVEIGEAQKFLLDKLYIVHRRGDPVEEARILSQLMDRYGFSQKDLASMLNVDQSQVSRLLSLLTLEKEFLKRIGEGNLAHSTAFELAKLPPEERMKFLDEERILLKDVTERRRDMNIEGLLDLVEQPIKGVERDIVGLEEAEGWWADLPEGEKIRIYIRQR